MDIIVSKEEIIEYEKLKVFGEITLIKEKKTLLKRSMGVL
jgi:hypothetical protein